MCHFEIIICIFTSVLIQPEKIYATNWASIENMEFEPDYNQSSCQKAGLKPFLNYFDVAK